MAKKTHVNVYPLSDLHVDVASFSVDWLNGDSNGILLLAGDLHTSPLNDYDTFSTWHVIDTLHAICEKYGDVVYVPGNHEYYGQDIVTYDDQLRRKFKGIKNLHIPDSYGGGTLFNIRGINIFAATTWFDGYSLHQPMTVTHDRWLRFSDYNNIRHGRRRVTLDQIRDIHNRTIKRCIDITPPGSVIVAHHAPTNNSVPNEYKTHSSTPFFATERSDIIDVVKPRLYVHGHVHDFKNYVVAPTQVICNPRGYQHMEYEEDTGVRYNFSIPIAIP